MIKLHHLNYSRSSRIIWLLEELKIEYEIIPYFRDKTTMRAPPELAKIHPMGKAPIIDDNGAIVAESGAIIEYLIAKYGEGKLAPNTNHPLWPKYLELLHFGESTAMLGPLIMLFTRGTDAALAQGYAMGNIKESLDFIETTLGENEYLLGGELSGADIQVYYVLDGMENSGILGGRAKLTEYINRIRARNAFKTALEKGGPISFPRK